MAVYSGRIGHLDGIESPMSNSGGCIKTLNDLYTMAMTGVGTIEDGSHVLGGPRLGLAWNPETGMTDKKVTHFDRETGVMTNALDMPGPGFDALEPEIPERVFVARLHKKHYILNVAPVSDDPLAELQELVSRGYEAGADAVLVNAGCPNVATADGGRHEILSYQPDVLRQVLFGLRKVTAKYKPIFLRLSPFEDGHQMLRVSQAVWMSKVVSAVYTPNTWRGHIPEDSEGHPILEVPGGVGGLSGPATAEAAAKQTQRLIGLLKGTGIDVVSSGGIMNAAELQKRLNLGAVAGAGTTFFYEAQNGWKAEVDKLLSELAT